MNRPLLLTLLMATTLGTAAAPAMPDKPAIRPSFLLPGDYHAEEAPLHPGGGWLALAPFGKGWELAATEVKSSRFHDEITDGTGERTGVRLESGRKGAIALLRLPYLSAGPRAAAAIRIDEGGLPIEAGKPVAIAFNGTAYRIEVVGKQVFLFRGALRTPLKDLKVHLEGEEGARLQWAGDLDGDGELDLMMAYFISNGGGACLYLSSQKTSGYLIKQIACHGGIGC